MNWVLENLPLIFSSGAIAIALFVLKRALNWAEWKGKADKSITSTECSINDIKKDIRTIQEDIKELLRRASQVLLDAPSRSRSLGRGSKPRDKSDTPHG